MEEQEQHLLKQNYVTNDKVQKPQFSGDSAAPQTTNESIGELLRKTKSGAERNETLSTKESNKL